MALGSALLLTVAITGAGFVPSASAPVARENAPAPFTISHISFLNALPQGSSPTSGGQARPGAGSGSANQPHEFGIGGVYGGTRGAGVLMRYFFNDFIGIDGRVSFSSRPLTLTRATAFTVEAAPSLIVMLTKPGGAKNVDVRPYMGAGVSYTHAGKDVTIGRPGTSGPGGQVFGGVEVEIRSAGSVAISGEVVYRKRSQTLVNASVDSGVAFVIGVGFYAK